MSRSTMGFDYGDGGLTDATTCFKRKYRWMFYIPSVSGDEGSPLLPPSKSARPSLSFKEMDAQHVSETIYFPSKPEWKPVNLTLYDIKKRINPVMEWIKKIYYVNDKKATWKPSASGGKIPQCKLELFDGVGNTIELWILENVWPQNIEPGELDYQSSEVCTIDLTLRYDRSYIID